SGLTSECVTAKKWYVASGLGVYETRDGGWSWRFRSKAGGGVSALSCARATATRRAAGIHFSSSGGQSFSSDLGDAPESLYWGTLSGGFYGSTTAPPGFVLLHQFEAPGGARIRSVVQKPGEWVLVSPQYLPLQRSADGGKTWRACGES